MWGAKTSLDRSLSSQIFNSVLKKYTKDGMKLKEYDQIFLAQYVYDLIKKKSTIHDSYTCKTFRDSEPFPTERKGRDHVGSIFSQGMIPTFNETCPIECRPKDHLNWIFC